MLLLFPLRSEARRLARELRRSTLNEPDIWEIDADRRGARSYPAATSESRSFPAGYDCSMRSTCFAMKSKFGCLC
jgi:hypothetical protein